MKRILVIEDDSAVRGLILETLKFKGWEPLDAADGAAGLELANRELPDLILCDIQMPKMDGYGVLQEIRKNSATSAIPFVFLTGLGDKPKMRKAMEAGADDYLVKPFTVQELIAAVDARFQKQAAFQETAEKRLHELRESLTFALPHELVTPLNTILGFSQLLLDSPEVSRQDLHEYATHIHNSGQRLRGLIEKFLLYAQVEMTAADPEQRKEHAQRPTHAAQETISTSAKRVAHERKREPDLRLALEPVEHRVSPPHLDRIVRELLENAFQFSDSGTPVEIKSSKADDSFLLEVTDRGRGFSPEQLKRIGANLQFDRQLQEQQGSGLGLAISRRLAELYGGTLRVESIPGKRTAVTVQLPA